MMLTSYPRTTVTSTLVLCSLVTWRLQWTSLTIKCLTTATLEEYRPWALNILILSTDSRTRRGPPLTLGGKHGRDAGNEVNPDRRAQQSQVRVRLKTRLYNKQGFSYTHLNLTSFPLYNLLAVRLTSVEYTHWRRSSQRSLFWSLVAQKCLSNTVVSSTHQIEFKW